MTQHELERLLLSPAQSVEPRVDHQSAGPEYFLAQVAEPVQRVGVDPDVVAQLLTVQPPALYIGRVDGKPVKPQLCYG